MICKVGDDTRQDALAMQMMQVMLHQWHRANCDAWVVCLFLAFSFWLSAANPIHVITELTNFTAAISSHPMLHTG